MFIYSQILGCSQGGWRKSWGLSSFRRCTFGGDSWEVFLISITITNRSNLSMMITTMVIVMTRAAGCQVVMVPDSRLADSEKKEATLCLEDLRQIQPEHFGLPAFKYSKVCVFVPQSRQSLLSFHIPDICHGRHGHVRVNFFWPV